MTKDKAIVLAAEILSRYMYCVFGKVTCIIQKYLWEEGAKVAALAGCEGFSKDRGWDLAEFQIDAETGELTVRCSRYPNQFGYSPETQKRISAEDFHSLAVELNMPEELRLIENETDWMLVLKDERIRQKCVTLSEDEKRRNEEVRLQNLVKIPARFQRIKPKLRYRLNFRLQQLYGSSGLSLRIEDNRYMLDSRGLNDAESAWVEHLISQAVASRDRRTWSSLAGGDNMTIDVYENDTQIVSMSRVKPLEKFMELYRQLDKLSAYGSDLIDAPEAHIEPETSAAEKQPEVDKIARVAARDESDADKDFAESLAKSEELEIESGQIANKTNILRGIQRFGILQLVFLLISVYYKNVAFIIVSAALAAAAVFLFMREASKRKRRLKDIKDGPKELTEKTNADIAKTSRALEEHERER